VFDFDMPVPLAVGIDKQLMAALGLSHLQAGVVIRWWVRHPLYAHAVAEEGSVRYNLDGEVSGPVEDEHRETARAWIAKARAAAAPRERTRAVAPSH
jgi:sRNA-binding protein